MRKGLKNIGFGLLAQLLTMAVGIVIPRLVLVNLGSESNGLVNSVNNILAYMSLLEAGVGTATLQALYKPCATGDHQSANSIMAATDFFYKRTGKIYFLIVVVISIVYTAVVHTELPRGEVFAVVLLAGLTGVISYFFQGKFKIFLSAEGKAYVNTNIVTTIHIITSITKALLLYMGHGVVAVQACVFAFNLIQMVVYYVFIKRNYQWIDLTVKPNIDAISQRNAVLIHQIASLVFNNTDILLLTLFAGLKPVSVYSMYLMIYGMVKTIAVVFYESYTYALGQSYNTDKLRFNRLFNAYEVLTIMITFSLYCICRTLINPFLVLYTDGINDIQYVDPIMPWLFAAFYLLHNGRTSSATVINIAQRFEDTKWRAIIEMTINLTVSIICVNRFGVYGVLIGTIAALLYRTNDMIIYAAGILKRSCWITYKRWLLNLVVFGGVSLVLNRFDFVVGNYFQLALEAVGISAFVFAVFFGVNVLVERDNIMNVIHGVMRLKGNE